MEKTSSLVGGEKHMHTFFQGDFGSLGEVSSAGFAVFQWPRLYILSENKCSAYSGGQANPEHVLHSPKT